MVEAALTISLALFTVMGMIELGVALFTYQSMTEGARRALRYAVVHPYDVDSIHNVAVYGNSAGTGSSFGGLSRTTVTVERQSIDSVNSVIRVVVTLPSYQFFTPLFPSVPFSMSTTAVRVAEGMGVTT